MTHDMPATSDVADTTTDKLILLRSTRGTLIEMTRAAQAQLEAEMARELGNPLDALMAEVVSEYRQMAPTRPDRPVRAA